ARPHDRVATQTYASALSQAKARKLPDCLVGECATAAHDSYRAGGVDVARHDANFAFPGSNHPWAVRADETRIGEVVGELLVNAGHVEHWHPFGDRNDGGDPS